MELTRKEDIFVSRISKNTHPWNNEWSALGVTNVLKISLHNTFSLCENFGQIYYLEISKSLELRTFNTPKSWKSKKSKSENFGRKKKMELRCRCGNTQRSSATRKMKKLEIPFPHVTNQEEGNRAIQRFLFTPQSTQTMQKLLLS